MLIAKESQKGHHCKASSYPKIPRQRAPPRLCGVIVPQVTLDHGLRPPTHTSFMFLGEWSLGNWSLCPSSFRKSLHAAVYQKPTLALPWPLAVATLRDVPHAFPPQPPPGDKAKVAWDVTCTSPPPPRSKARAAWDVTHTQHLPLPAGHKARDASLALLTSSPYLPPSLPCPASQLPPTVPGHFPYGRPA